VEFAVTPERVARASCDFPYHDCAPDGASQPESCHEAQMLAEKAGTSVIAIDERGHYTPVSFNFAKQCRLEPIRQPTPGVNCVPQPEGPIAEEFTDCFVQHAKAIRSNLQSPPPGKTYHLLVFIHGGLNLEQGRLERAFVDANRMLADRSAAVIAGRAAGRLEGGEIWYPLFITWPSGGVQSYLDQRIHYNQGDYGSEYKRLMSPLYFLTDAVEAVVRAPVAWAESFSWVDLGQTPTLTHVGDAIGCEQQSKPAFVCVPVERDDRSTLQEVAYWSPVGFVGRAITVPAVDVVGQPAWDAMISRTRMLMRKPFNADDFAAADGKLDGKGDLWYLFNVIGELAEDERPAITLIGHSMGAIVVNEILRNFPDLPYRSIVYMGAAASVRDTLAALDHVTRINPRPDLRFYNLSLHQLAEANEVGYFGTVSKGSLLEWVDRMYTTPATFADRTVGKWINAVMARGDFLPLASRLQLSFKRFGLSCAEPLKHTEFDEYEPRAGCPETRTPYWHPTFWAVPEAPPRG
jgi:pimeloyl-ACP methyl ester carboxylesterase